VDVKFFIPLFVLSALCLSCGTRKPEPAEPPIITSATYQHTLYNGERQPIDARSAGDGAPLVITYFPSLEALERDEGGSAEAPSEVGSYYARIERPAGEGYAGGRPVSVEYYIQKALVTITAGENQEAAWDGLPKQVSAEADKPVPLTVTYYAADSEDPLPGPPSDPGRYRVRVSFAGNERYLGSSREISFTIKK
jgi:hypothetical protein